MHNKLFNFLTLYLNFFLSRRIINLAHFFFFWRKHTIVHNLVFCFASRCNHLIINKYFDQSRFRISHNWEVAADNFAQLSSLIPIFAIISVNKII